MLLASKTRELQNFQSNSHLDDVTKSIACWKFMPSQRSSFQACVVGRAT